MPHPLPLLLALLVALLTAAGCERAPRLANGDAAPDFTLEPLSGGRLGLAADLAGQVVAVRFWADWCRYCEKEMRELEPVYQRLKGRGLALVAINVGQGRERVAAFAGKLGISYPLLLDPESATARRYGVMALPTTLFVDRQGRIRGRILGESEAAVFEQMASELL